MTYQYRLQAIHLRTLGCAVIASCALAAPARSETGTVDVGFTSKLGIPGFVEDQPKDPKDPLNLIEPKTDADDEGPPKPQIELGSVDESNATSVLSLLDAGAIPQSTGPVLTLDEATALALENNPELIALALEVDADFAQVLQASVKPTPELDISLSEFLGMNDRRMFRHSVSEVTYSKVLERLDKRLARQRVARLGGELARWDYEARLRDIQQTVSANYVAVLVAQDRLRVEQQLLALIEALRNAVSLRFEAGTVSQLELSRIDIEVSNARISADQAESEFSAAKKRLSALWGDLTPDFETVEGKLDDTPVPPDIETLTALLPDNPFLARFATEAAERQARLDLALQEDRPEYTIHGGVQGFGDSAEMAMTVGVTVPTKKRNLNPGGIREAKIRIEQVESQKAATQLQLQAQLVDALERLHKAYDRSRRLSVDVIPAARKNLDDTVIGYRYGKFSYLDVLEGERTLIEAVGSYVDALAEYQAARVEVERLVGKPLALVAGPEEATVAVTEVNPSTEVESAEESTDSPADKQKPDVDTETSILEDGNG